MNAHALQFRIAEAIVEHVAESGQNATGRALGVAGTTVGRWGDCLDSWPLSHGLALAQRSPDVRAAMVAFLAGDRTERAGEPLAALTSLREQINEQAALIGQINAAVGDNQIDDTEGPALLRALVQHAEHVATAIAHLKAKGVRP